MTENRNIRYNKIFDIFMLIILIFTVFYPYKPMLILISIIIILFLSSKIIFINVLKLRNEKYKLIKNKSILSSINIPENISLPYVIVDENKNLIAYNEIFKQLFSDLNLYDININDIFKEYETYINKQCVNFSGRYFDAYTEKCSITDISKDVYSVIFCEVTEFKNLIDNAKSTKAVTGLVYIDNYEEVIESVEEESLPILSALIDRTLSDFVQKLGGIIKKFEKDRYILIISKKSLDELKTKKFEILNKIKEINIGEHIPVTLSIGIGTDNDTIDKAMKNSKNAIELALGRGGDQAVIKECENYIFYGGKSGEISHNARIRARVKADALKELMLDASNVYVMGHKNGDLDSMGSSIGIYAIAKSVGKDCHIILDNISVSIKKICDRIKEQGLYDDMFIKTPQALEKITNKTLIIITDTHRKYMVESIESLEKAKKVVVFDHHRKSTDFIDNAVLVYHEPYASSTCELVTEMIRYMGVKLKNIEADSLLAGITIDTKNFAIKTGAITFETAAFLKRNGADSIRVRILFQNDIEEYKAKATTVKDAEIYRENIAISVCPPNIKNSSITAAQSADDLLNITGIKGSVVLCEYNDTIYLSARSLGEINVQLIMEKLGGGGHLGIAGAQLKNMDIQTAKILLKQKIDEYLEEDI